MVALTQARAVIARVRSLVSRRAPTPRYARIDVLAPANGVSGGPEALHQLVDALRRRGHQAFISYYPAGSRTVPAEYARYDIACGTPEDETGNLIVVPEVATGALRRFRRSQRAIWWLSVDNFLDASTVGRTDITPRNRAGPARMTRGEPTGHPHWAMVRGVLNFSQSAYAMEFLEQRGVRSTMLTDYINTDFITAPPSDHRIDIIAYNPKKGLETTQRLTGRFPHLVWLPLRDMNRTQVIEALRMAKAYVDFGAHPGRDRIPREAALSGACVVVGRRGSAAFKADVPVPEKYKLDEAAPDFEENFGNLCTAIFENYREHRANFSSFVKSIKAQRKIFEREIASIFELSE